MKPLKERWPWGLITSVLLFFLAFCYAMFQGGFVSWFLFYAYLPVFVYALLLGIYPLNAFHVEREIDIKGELQSGDSAWVKLTLTRSFPFPLFYIAIEEGLPKRIRDRGKVGHLYRGLFPMHFRRTLIFHYEIPSLPRGEHAFNEVVIKTGDLFGMIQKSITLSCQSEFTVFPKQSVLTAWQPIEHTSGGSSRARKQFEMDLTSISSVRDYAAGDRLSWLDWKATARANKLVTKQFDFPVNRDVLFVLDATSRNLFSEEAFERSVSLTATLAKRSLDLGAGVGLLTINEKQNYIQMAGGLQQQWMVMKHLARVEPRGSHHPAAILHNYLKAIPQQMTCIYIGQTIDEELITLFSEYLYRGLEVEQFLVKNQENVTSLEFGHIESFKRLGIRGHLIPTDDFDYALRVGGHRATI